jgi:16S rRNA (cytosine1402-N4)-methyltransferase
MENEPDIEIVHVPIMTAEILENLKIDSGSHVIDGTADGGGHTIAILNKIGGTGKLISIEQDKEMVQYLKERLEKEGLLDGRVKIVMSNYKRIDEIVAEEKMERVDAVLFDLGMSSYHVNFSDRGFTFRENQPLDMRYSTQTEVSAMDVVNKFNRNDIEEILKNYGEEKFAAQIAEGIVEERKEGEIMTTGHLVAVIERWVPPFYRHRKISCATKTFQALRIFVNDEFGNIREGLEKTYQVLKEGGRMGIISFHSLEDRIVKEFGKDKKQNGLMEIITKKPITPKWPEVKQNKRSRSAKLRIFEKTK